MKRTVLSLAVGLVLAIGGIKEGSTESNQMTNWENVILMAAGDCGSLGPNWKRYKPISGRFAVATGEGDDGKKTKAFKLENKGGEYEHVLTVDEMPSHQHGYDSISRGHMGRRVTDYGDDQANSHENELSKTKSTGGGNPHNNMPPYLVLNFCHFDPNP